MSILNHLESELYFICFWIPDYVRKILKSFENSTQLVGLVGKPDHPVH